MHIPKCAGTTVRDALAPFDEAANRYYDKAVATHPEFGPLDFHHIPLAVLRDHFPQDFARLSEYRSFALFRDPASRFPSSIHERFVQKDGVPLTNRDPDEVAREVDLVLAELARQPSGAPIINPELIHFSRQRDYVMLDGVQIVGSARTVAQVDSLLAELSGIVGQPVRTEGSKNRRYQYNSRSLERTVRAVAQPIEAVLPVHAWKRVYKPIKSAFLYTGLLRRVGDALAELPNAAEIDAFVADFYADDFALFNRLVAASRQSGKTEAPA